MLHSVICYPISFLADRKVLALDPDCGNIMKCCDSEESNSERRPQLSPTEKVIAEVWADVLDISVSNLTPTSSFTEVGGHSLFLFEVVMGIKEKVCCYHLSIVSLLFLFF